MCNTATATEFRLVGLLVTYIYTLEISTLRGALGLLREGKVIVELQGHSCCDCCPHSSDEKQGTIKCCLLMHHQPIGDLHGQQRMVKRA